MKILTIADIHIGSIKDVTYVYNVMTDIIDKEIMFQKTDLVVILGDYFHRLFKVNEEYVSLAINIMSYLIRACSKSKTKIRIVYGTESHEMNQYKLFNYHITSTRVDMKVFDTVTEEETLPGTKILYIPEEYMFDKHEHYKDYLYSGKTYDYIFGHGVIVDGMPKNISYDNASKNDEKQVPKFKSGEFSEISKITAFGHYHVKVDMGNVHYVGSLFRDSFGEETAKGYAVIEDGEYKFIENKEAYEFNTYEFNETSSIFNDSDELIKAIKEIKENNKDIINGDKTGKVRIIFKPPVDIDPSFKENLKGLLLGDKNINSIIKETSDELLEAVKDDLDDEWNFIIDSSMPKLDKVHRFMTMTYDDPLSIETLEKYIGHII